MKIGFAQGSPRSPIGPQLTALAAAGCRKVFRTDKGDTWEDFVGALRQTSQPVVVELFNIADNREDMFAKLGQLSEKGLMLWVVSDKRYIDSGTGVSIRKAIKHWRGLRTIPTKLKAQSMANASMKSRNKKHLLRQDNRNKLLTLWRDKRIKTDIDAAILIGEKAGRTYSVATLRREFKRSGRPRGRRK